MSRALHGLGVLIGAALSFATTASGAETKAHAPHARHDGQPLHARIEIERAAGAEACPDSAEVFRAMARLFPERAFREASVATESVASAHISIRPLPPGYEAVVSVIEPRRGERVILEKAADCRGLADALALAFVMLVEPPTSEAAARGETDTPTATPPAPAPPAAASPRRDTAAAPTPSRERSFQADLGASAVAGVGLLSEPSLGAAGGLDVFHTSGWGASLQGMRLSSPPSRAEGGSVTLTLWGVSLGPCYRGRLSPRSSLDGCVRFGAGSQHAEVERFRQPKSGSFPWLVVVPALAYRQLLVEPLSGFVRVGPVVQLLPQSFSVRVPEAEGGLVNVAAAPNVGVMAELGLAFGGRIF